MSQGEDVELTILKTLVRNWDKDRNNLYRVGFIRFLVEKLVEKGILNKPEYKDGNIIISISKKGRKLTSS